MPLACNGRESTTIECIAGVLIPHLITSILHRWRGCIPTACILWAESVTGISKNTPQGSVFISYRHTHIPSPKGWQGSPLPPRRKKPTPAAVGDGLLSLTPCKRRRSRAQLGESQNKGKARHSLPEEKKPTPAAVGDGLLSLTPCKRRRSRAQLGESQNKGNEPRERVGCG